MVLFIRLKKIKFCYKFLATNNFHKMNKPTIIYLLLLFSFFTSSLGEECSDYIYSKSYACSIVKLNATDKSCTYINVNDECKELPNQCSEYKGSVASECQSINNPLANRDNPFKACIFESNSCQLKEFTKCSDYKAGLPEKFCENIIPSDGSGCKLVNNECTIYYEYCSDYIGSDKNTCESIELENPFKQCSYSQERGCEEKQKSGITCNSYRSGQDSYYCREIELEDAKKHCVFYENKCSEYYQACSDITDENECNSNIPYNNYQYKCFYKDSLCTQVLKTCSDYKEGEGFDSCRNIHPADQSKECRLINGQCTEVDKTQKPSCSDYKKGLESEYCIEIILEDTNKYCIFRKNECIESYKSCSSYTGSDASVCNSIIRDYGRKCVFENNACKDKPMKCSEYTTILDAEDGYSCVNIIPSNVMKKCVYSDHNCKEEDKYSTEFTSGATEEIGEKAPTSSEKKKCVLSDDNKTCVEKESSYFIISFSSLLFLLLL